MYQTEKIIQEVNGVSYEITMTRKNVKRMTLRIDRQGNPCLSVPVQASRGEIWKFMMSCSDWLSRYAGKRTFFTLPEEIHSGDEVMILGELRQIFLQRAGKPSLSFSDGSAVLELRDPEDPVKAAAAYERALRELALRVFKARLRRYLHIIPEKYGTPEIKIRKMTSRWGSANQTTGEIHLSLYLIKAPVECIDSVVLHEAAHFTYMDHGTKFYDLLTDQMPDYRERSRRLKNYARS